VCDASKGWRAAGKEERELGFGCGAPKMLCGCKNLNSESISLFPASERYGQDFHFLLGRVENRMGSGRYGGRSASDTISAHDVAGYHSWHLGRPGFDAFCVAFRVVVVTAQPHVRNRKERKKSKFCVIEK
jgi:hypothetical protein